MSTPAIYRTRVRGSLPPEAADRLECMNITNREIEGVEESILVGRLVDQSALSGLLASLYELHLPLISVECLEADD